MSRKTENDSTEKTGCAIGKPPCQPVAGGCFSYDSILYKSCQEDGIKLEFLCHNWVKKLIRNGAAHYIAGYKFDLNPQAASLVADDKVATSAALISGGLPAVQHTILYQFSNQADYASLHNSWDFAEKFFHQHNENIVIKPNRGSGGRQTFRVTEVEQIMPVLMELFYNNEAVALCPFYEVQQEYRAVILDGKVKLFYRKKLEQNNQSRKINASGVEPRGIKPVQLFNLCQGARAEALETKDYPEIIDLAKAAVRNLGLRFCSVDIIETRDGERKILEVNSGVMAEYYLRQRPEDYEKVKKMYQMAIRKMFEKENDI